MVSHQTVALSIMLLAASCRAPTGEDRAEHGTSRDALPEIELIRAGEPVELDAAAARVLVERVERALEGCNFSSTGAPELFGDVDLRALWLQREAGSHLRLRYAVDRRLESIAGELVVRDVLLSVDQPHGPEPALIEGPAGLQGPKKCGYDDRLLGCVPELADYFSRLPDCPPGI